MIKIQPLAMKIQNRIRVALSVINIFIRLLSPYAPLLKYKVEPPSRSLSLFINTDLHHCLLIRLDLKLRVS